MWFRKADLLNTLLRYIHFAIEMTNYLSFLDMMGCHFTRVMILRNVYDVKPSNIA